MGRATITKVEGEGLFKIRLLFDTARLDSQIAAVQSEKIKTADLLTKTTQSWLLIDRARIEAEAKLAAILDQWEDGLISPGDDVPPELTPDPPDDPETGLPWEDPDRAQDAPLFAAINAERTAASVPTLARSADLDTAILQHLHWQTDNQASGHIGLISSLPSDRVSWTGYAWDTVDELLSYGRPSATDVVSSWLAIPEMKAILLSADMQDVGVAYVYGPQYTGCHLWGAVFAVPGIDPPDVNQVPEKDPAKDAAESGEIEKIEPPKPDDIPPSVQAASKELAEAAGKSSAAKKEVERLKALSAEQDAREDELQAAKDDIPSDEIHAWTADYTDSIPIGDIVAIAEMPGYLDAETITPRSVTLFADTTYRRTIDYNEHELNILPASYRHAVAAGQVAPSEPIPAATIFWNAAMEPGHLKWRPLWRYGTITAKNGNQCDLTLTEAIARKLPREVEMDLNPAANLSGVPFFYPNDHGGVFAVGDEVLILFEGQDRDHPKVVGFRREPRRGLRDWGEIIPPSATP